MTKFLASAAMIARRTGLIWLTLMSGVALGETDGHLAMQNYYTQFGDAMKHNVYNEPLHIVSSFKDDTAAGEIFALIKNDFVDVSLHLVTAEQWCDMLELHVNVKGCYAGKKLNNDKDKHLLPANQLIVFAGRDYYQQLEDAYVMKYALNLVQQGNDYVKTSLSAEFGPFGTSDYLLEFEAIPITRNTTFMHFSYSYHYGFMASLALGGYLATLGRGKVGFSIEKYDADNKPVYVKGMQGIVERNSMRYFLAIRAFLDSFKSPQEDANSRQSRINRWYQLALPFSLQLGELENNKYLETKKLEIENKPSLEAALAIVSGNNF